MPNPSPRTPENSKNFRFPEGTAFTDADGFEAEAADSDFVFIVLTRREVEAGNVSDALDRLLALSDTPEHVMKFRDRVALAFEGYDTDPREIHEVPEAVAFFRKLTSHWPFWFHFAEKAGDTIGLLFWMLCDVEVVTGPGGSKADSGAGMDPDSGSGMVGCRFTDPDSLGVVMQHLFDAMNSLYEANGISEADNELMTAKVLAAFETTMG